MKKILCLLICLTFAFTAAGCDLFKSDQEKYDELTAKFKQDCESTSTSDECKKIGEEYKNAVPKSFKDKASSEVSKIIFMYDVKKYKDVKLGESSGSSKIANYPE